MMKQVIEYCGEMAEVLINEAGEVVGLAVNNEAVEVVDTVAKAGILSKVFNKKVLIAAGTAAVVAGGVVLYKKHKEKKEAKFEEAVNKRVEEILAKMKEEENK